MIEILGHYIINFISSTGYWGVFLLMTVESALIPMPSEVTMPFSGYLVTTGRFNLFLVVLTGAIGNLVGSLAAYYLGYWGEDHFVRKFIRKFGKYFLISEHEYDRSEKWFRKYGEAIVFVSRLLPAVRTYISLPAGIAKMNPVKFILYTFIGSLIWTFALTYIGVALGNRWQTIGAYFHAFDALIVIGFILAVFLYIRHKVKKRGPSLDSPENV